MSVLKHYYEPCPTCNGAGEVRKIAGSQLRLAREQKGISLRTMAKTLKFSAPYLCDVERGRRNCTKQIEQAYANL